jgi:hypothetical protein
MSVYKEYVKASAADMEKLDKRFKKSCNRQRTSRCETLLIKALTASTKTVESQQTSIKATFTDHAKQTKEEAEALPRVCVVMERFGKLPRAIRITSNVKDLYSAVLAGRASQTYVERPPIVD